MQKNKSKKSPSKKKSPAPKVPDSKPWGAAPKRVAAASKKSAPKGTAKPGAMPDPKPVASKSTAARAPAASPEKSPKRGRKKVGTPEVESPKPLADETPRPAASEAPRPVAPDQQPKPERTSAAALDDDDRADCIEIPGDAIDGTRLSHAIRYAARVTPRKGGHVVFSAANDGQPLVSGHDLRRSHTGFLSLGAACHLEAAVPRAEAIELADAIDGLAGPRVRIAADGLVLIRHGVGQPAMRFRIGSRAITFAWAPPSQSGRTQADGSLRIQASWQQEACKWSKAIVHTFQSKDGIEFNTLTDAESGELLGRAVLAEDGRDLYAEDDRQTELPGSRTAGGSRFDRAVEGMGARGGVAGAVDDLKRTLRETGTTMTIVAGGQSVTIGGNAPAPAAEAEPVVRIDGQPVTDAPVEGAVVAPAVARQWVEASAWEALSAEARAAFESVEAETSDGAAASAHIIWERQGDFVTTEVSEDLAAILWDAAVDADLDLHEGPEPPTRIWVAQSAWDDLSEAATEALTEPVAGTRLALKGRSGFVTALVPAAAFGALERRADEHDVTLHLGAEPPATNAGRGVA